MEVKELIDFGKKSSYSIDMLDNKKNFYCYSSTSIKELKKSENKIDQSYYRFFLFLDLLKEMKDKDFISTKKDLLFVINGYLQEEIERFNDAPSVIFDIEGDFLYVKRVYSPMITNKINPFEVKKELWRLDLDAYYGNNPTTFSKETPVYNTLYFKNKGHFNQDNFIDVLNYRDTTINSLHDLLSVSKSIPDLLYKDSDNLNIEYKHVVKKNNLYQINFVKKSILPSTIKKYLIKKIIEKNISYIKSEKVEENCAPLDYFFNENSGWLKKVKYYNKIKYLLTLLETESDEVIYNFTKKTLFGNNIPIREKVFHLEKALPQKENIDYEPFYDYLLEYLTNNNTFKKQKDLIKFLNLIFAKKKNAFNVYILNINKKELVLKSDSLLNKKITSSENFLRLHKSKYRYYESLATFINRVSKKYISDTYFSKENNIILENFISGLDKKTKLKTLKKQEMIIFDINKLTKSNVFEKYLSETNKDLLTLNYADTGDAVFELLINKNNLNPLKKTINIKEIKRFVKEAESLGIEINFDENRYCLENFNLIVF